MKLRGHVANFHIHVSVSDLYIPMISEIGGPIVGIYTGTGGAVTCTGGAVTGTGGAVTGTGGAVTSTGGAVTSTDGAVTGTGGAVCKGATPSVEQ
jgi:hypothetical protein